MPFIEKNGLRYYQFDLFQGLPLVHAVFTRAGGTSPAPFESLNLGGTVGDERANVIENRRRLFEALSLPVESIYDAWQVHGTHVIPVTSPRPLDAPHEKGDAILTNRQGITLFMRFADCVPIFLYDPQNNAIGIVHAGWKGAVQRVAQVAVERMREEYNTRPEDLLAAIGPSICAGHYQVGEEVIAAARESFGDGAKQVLKHYPDGIHLDLWEANRLTLAACGVKRIETAGLCTFEHTGDWYSHRAEHGKTGRFGALLALARS